MKMKLAGAAAAFAMSFALQAQAATTTETIDFTASDFGVGAPIDSVTGSFTVTFDPATASVGFNSGAVIDSLSIAGVVDPSLETIYSFLSPNEIRLYSGNFATGPSVVLDVASPAVVSGSGTGVFSGSDFFRYDLTGNAYFGTGTPFLSTTGTFTVSQVSAAPEPATWLLMFAGVGVVGGALRMRRREFNGLATA